MNTVKRGKSINNKQEQEKRRLEIIDFIKNGYREKEIAKRLEVPIWTIVKDLKRMRYHRDQMLKEAYCHANEKTRIKKQLRANLSDEKFHRITGMTFKEKTQNNMIFFIDLNY
jgi:transposase